MGRVPVTFLRRIASPWAEVAPVVLKSAGPGLSSSFPRKGPWRLNSGPVPLTLAFVLLQAGGRSRAMSTPPLAASGMAPGPFAGPQAQQAAREVNTASLCRIGQETVQDIVYRTMEIFQLLRNMQVGVQYGQPAGCLGE